MKDITSWNILTQTKAIWLIGVVKHFYEVKTPTIYHQLLFITGVRKYPKEPSINYVISVGRGLAPKTIYYIDLNFKKDDKGGGGKNCHFWDNIVYGRPLRI